MSGKKSSVFPSLFTMVSDCAHFFFRDSNNLSKLPMAVTTAPVRCTHVRQFVHPSLPSSSPHSYFSPCLEQYFHTTGPYPDLLRYHYWGPVLILMFSGALIRTLCPFQTLYSLQKESEPESVSLALPQWHTESFPTCIIPKMEFIWSLAEMPCLLAVWIITKPSLLLFAF